MDPKQAEERRRLVTEGARKKLAEKTWPEVMMVFGYPTPKAKFHSDEEVANLRATFEKAGCPNIVVFIDLVRFQEKQAGVPMSFNFSLRRRDIPYDVEGPMTTQKAIAMLSCPDILVGTRWGKEAAFKWLENCSKTIPELVPESVQVMDKIFGEAIEFLRSHSGHTTDVRGLIDIALGEEELPETGSMTPQ